MSKMSEIDQAIKDISNAAAVISDAASWLSKQLSNSEEDDPEPQKKELKLEDVRAVLAEKSRAGHTDEIRELLHKYGANKLSDVDPQNYEALIRDAEEIQ
ncbi:DNA ligase [Ligilactobacillus ruminis]|uniref:DNA ligase n=1 Tax=Ligilactobacillus ruminis TaxID=1623 RepID=UPI00147502FA|nr:DNA ligase [Ligilactobacillus ruminis]MCF2544260.1 DNA ligase [Ligilactobacillus ruminis]NME31879.1 DNA ligase [Ligilactobacillus ruminis]DAP75094.1 MAG TPA: hypothetical protein [Caudoviricetes sp.]